MMPFFHNLEQYVFFWASQVPLELFVFVGALAEELIAPIPSMLIMTTAGLLAHVEGHTSFFLIWLVAIGNLGKLLGSWFYYLLGDKLEDIVLAKWGRFLGLRHEDVESIGKRLGGNNPWRNGAVIFLLRTIPFVPTVIVSFAAGVIKIRQSVFLLASYIGNFCKDSFYIFAGYFGAQALRTFFIEIERIRFGMGILISLFLAILLVLAYRKRHHGLRLFHWIKQHWHRFFHS